MKTIRSITTFFVLIIAFGCSRKLNYSQTLILPGNDPNFMIKAHNDAGYKATNRKVVVFGIPIYAYAEVEDEKLLHAANIMAQYLDNNEDGIVDNAIVHTTLLENNASLFMWKKTSQIRIHAQDLGADETIPDWHFDNTKRFDASLEEIWHVITHSGYSKAYPEIFGEKEGTALTEAMDIARGGYFKKIPTQYPSEAWYSYDDKTCHYDCMATEYFYWAMTSYLGAQKNRLDQIGHEWKLNTKEKMESKDKRIVKLLSDPQYKFPKVLPNGKYKQ